MPVQQGKKKVKTDRRDARKIAKCLAHHEYSAVHIPTAGDEETKEYLRMRDDHKLALKKIKQQILSFCLRHGYNYTGGSQNWTKTHLKWLRELKPGGMYQEILEEYLLTYNNLVNKLECPEAFLFPWDQDSSRTFTHYRNRRLQTLRYCSAVCIIPGAGSRREFQW